MRFILLFLEIIISLETYLTYIKEDEPHKDYNHPIRIQNTNNLTHQFIIFCNVLLRKLGEVTEMKNTFL